MTSRQRRSRPEEKDSAAPRKRIVVGHEVLARSRAKPEAASVAQPFALPAFPPDVAPSAGLAQDSALGTTTAWAAGIYAALAQREGMAFLGFPALAEMAQRPEYRRAVEVLATEFTRKWIKIVAEGKAKGEKTERIDKINAALKRYNVRDLFRRATEVDGFFGRAHIYVDLGTGDDATEMMSPIGGGRDEASKAKITKGSLRGFRIVEPVWAYPSNYNTTDPLSADWYRPSVWNVQGKPVHASRLLTLIGREVPDLLKPSYAFGGVSMSQLLKPYVDNWIRTRQSVSDLVSSFSVSGVKTNLAGALAGGVGSGDELFRRIDLFNNLRNNRGTMVLDKGAGPTEPAEEFFNVSTPLSTLDKLQAQAQEHLASIPGIALVKMFGLQPTGLNASSDGEIRVFYDWIAAKQEDDYRSPLATVIDFIQLSEFGDVDEDIGFEFVPLWQMSDQEKATIAKDAATAVVGAEAAGITDRATSLRELRKSGETTGIFTTITDELITEAENEPPAPDLDATDLRDDPDGDDRPARRDEQVPDRPARRVPRVSEAA